MSLAVRHGTAKFKYVELVTILDAMCLTGFELQAAIWLFGDRERFYADPLGRGGSVY